MNCQSDTKDVNIQNQIKSIIENIKDEFYFNDEEIENDLKQWLDQLDEPKRDVIIKELQKQFFQESFIKRPYFKRSYITENQPLKQQFQDYKSVYQENIKNKQYDLILQELKNEQYCQTNLIPIEIKKYLNLLERLGENIQFIFQLIELVKERHQYNFLSLLIALINLFFLECDQNLKKEINQLIGILLQNLIYQFQNYEEMVMSYNDQEKSDFIQFIQKVQFKEITVKEGLEQLQKKVNNKSICFLFELFTTKLEFHYDKLIGFMKNLIDVKQICQDDLIQYISLTENFDENLDFLYYSLIFYFWIQLFNSNDVKLIMEQIEQKLSKTQKKQGLLEEGIKRMKNQQSNIIFNFLINKIVYYRNQKDEDFIKKQKEQETQELELIQKYEKLISTNINAEMISNLSQFGNIKRMMFYQFQKDKQFQFNQQIQLSIFLATNNLNNDSEKILNQIIKKTEKLQFNQLTKLDKFEKINLLYFEYVFMNKKKPQIKISRFVHHIEIFNNYPKQLKIKMEDFNIQLISEQEKEKNIQEWLENKSDEKTFKNLLPYYFNIIKRGESAEHLLGLINNKVINNQRNKKFETLNIKSLFQLLYNNSDKELQVMLLKLHSKHYPVPLLYQNPLLENINSNLDFYVLNSNIFYLLSNDFTIINFSLSKKQHQFGKTELINMLFYNNSTEYKIRKFEVCDSSLINNNSVDCQFDFSFNGTRNYLITDVHGKLEDEILKNLLPFFNLWIIQMQTEDEYEENVNKLIELFDKSTLSQTKIVLIIRDSMNKELNKDKINNLQKKDFDFKTYRIPNLLKLDDMAQQIDERQKIKDFILKTIDNQNETVNEGKLKNSFLKICQAFKTKDDEIERAERILQELETELNKNIQNPDGFYSSEAFPLRHLAWQMQKLKKQKQNFYQKKCQFEQEQENKINQIKYGRKTAYNIEQQQKGKQKEQEKVEIEKKIFKTKEELKKIDQEIRQIEEKIKKPQDLEQSKLIKLFSQVFQSNNFYIIYLRFVEQIGKFNQRNIKNLGMQIEQIKKQCGQAKQQQNDQILEKQLKDFEEKFIVQNISIELFWREIINSNSSFSVNPIDIVSKLIKKGEPFEFLSGDDLSIDSNFFHQLREQLLDQKDKILILSVLGPQSSGKSTLLNRIFGCHFLTSVGRCTKGLFLQLLKISNKQQFGEGLFDYILLLDSEGLQNPKQQDPEFDKKISLFILSISDIIIFNVKGEIHASFHKLIEASVYTIEKFFQQNFLKQFAWCFNQNSQINEDEKYKLIKQIETIGVQLKYEESTMDESCLQIDQGQDQQISDDQHPIIKQFDFTKYLEITKDEINILGMAQVPKEWLKYQFQEYNNSNLSQIQEIKYEINESDYSKNALKFGLKIIQQFIGKLKQRYQDSPQILTWDALITKAEENWELVTKLPDLVEFSDLKEQRDYQKIKSIALTKINKVNEKFLNNLAFLNEKSKDVNTLDDYNLIQKEIQDLICIQINQAEEKILSELKDNYASIISSETRKKVEETVKEIYKAQILDRSLLLLQKIHQEKRKFQYRQFPTKISQKIAEILKNQNQLEIQQKNQDKRNESFKEIFEEIVDQSNKEIENIHIEFSKQLFDCFKNYKKDQIYEFNNLDEKTEYFLKKINNQDPNKNKEESNLICQQFSKDFEYCAFNIINKQSKHELQQIFYLDIWKRLDNLPLIDPIIDPWKYLKKEITYNYLEMENIVREIKANLKQELIKIIKEDNKDEQKKQIITNLFKLLQKLPIEFNQLKLQELNSLMMSNFQDLKNQLFQKTESKQFPKLEQKEKTAQSVKIASSSESSKQQRKVQNSEEQQQIQKQKNNVSINQVHQKFNTANQPVFQKNSTLIAFKPEVNYKKTQMIEKPSLIDDLINSVKIKQQGSQDIDDFTLRQFQNIFPKIQIKKTSKIEDNQKKQYLILKENKSIIYNKENKKQFDEFFQHIISSQIAQRNQPQFQNKQVFELMLQIMQENKGWEKLCQKIYDTIQNQKPQQEEQCFKQIIDVNLNESMTKYNCQLIKGMMQKVENIILTTNKQLAFFGVQFSQGLFRKMQSLQLFIIWRFLCYDKLKMYDLEQKELLEKKEKFQIKYENGILQKVQEESKQQAKELAQKLNEIFRRQFFIQNLNNVENIINKNKITSNEVIKELDQLILIDKRHDIISGQNIENTICSYILDQKGIIEKYTQQQILKVKKLIQIEFSEQIHIQECLNKLKNNAIILKDRIQNLYQKQKLQKDEYFYGLDEDQKNVKYTQRQVMQFILGNDVEKIDNQENILQFDNNLQKLIIDKQPQISDGDEISIYLLNDFLEGFISQIDIFYENSKTLETQIDRFEVEDKFEEMKNIMNGCDQLCPMCNRKCDNEDYQDINHIHKCQNGHQLRGMNKVLIGSSPSTYTCEEILDEAEIQIKETRKFETWNKIKQYYRDWSFKDIFQSQTLEQNLLKMRQIWNGGVGQYICKQLQEDLNEEILFKQKHDHPMNMQINSTHYIFILDDSGSMINSWNFLIQSVSDQFKVISKKSDAKISVIIFNKDARIVINCEELKIQEQLKLLQFQNGSDTKFGPPFKLAFDLISSNSEFTSSIILFYTDGIADYPEQEINQFRLMPKWIKNTIYLLACSQNTIQQSLFQIIQFGEQEFAKAKLRDNVHPSDLSFNWSEMISKTYHKYLDKYQA
ncbi:unnamed protein product [Paramecium sonneborni]|uniref:VLIG-type G domain-containing protein n=1 Tax=Paramecium sonneborni TaxID=65129 RepID=A0A8S1PRN2_9CILI|nr:unnamed protein product [Paramecium sonneborni]